MFRRHGFTLIELLVVLGIVSLLMALALPSLYVGKQRAVTATCASNLRQLTMSLILYESDNAAFPPGFIKSSAGFSGQTFPGNLASDKAGWWWFDYIRSYTQTDFETPVSVLWCPGRQVNNSAVKYNVLCANYGVNQSICRSLPQSDLKAALTGAPLGAGHIRKPTSTVLILDSGYATITWWHASDKPPVSLGREFEDTAYVPGLKTNAARKLRVGLESDAIYGRHPNRTVNTGFADGHVDLTAADKLGVEKKGSEYENCSPLWQP